MPKSLDPKLEREIHRDILRKDASTSLDKAVQSENPYVIADLIDHAVAAVELHDKIGDAEA